MTFQWKWLHGDFDDPVELRSFAALKVILNNEILTRAYDQLAGGERDSINVVLYPLASFVAENWWTLLHEPRKSDEDDSLIQIRHSLDSYMTGFVFPPLTIWSGGKDSIIVEHPAIRQQYSNLEFMPLTTSVTNLSRTGFEENLFDLVSAVVSRLPRAADTELQNAWARVLQSLRDDSEREYCEAAGRLGIDPYNPDCEDISSLFEGLSENLLADICEAVTPHEVLEATEWARHSTGRLQGLPDIDIKDLGALPPRVLSGKIWTHGYDAARSVIKNWNLDSTNPRRMVDQIFGPAVSAEGVIGPHPLSLEALTARRDGTMRVAIPATSARQRRSRLCRALYLAWKTTENDLSAVTTASTLDQQASRAFAAELLSPADLLREWAGGDGLTPEKIETFAAEHVCPEQTIIWQAHNHGIPLRGVSLPKSQII